MSKEASIIINGVPLTDAQVSTIRLALSGYANDLSERGLGDDEHGKFMTAAYLSRIAEMESLIYRN